MTKPDYEATLNERFKGRKELSRRDLFDKHFASLGVQAPALDELMDLLETEFHVRSGLLRPEDSVELLLRPVSSNSVTRWFEYQTRAGDAKSELNFLLGERLERAGTLAKWGKISTISDLARAWSSELPIK